MLITVIFVKGNLMLIIIKKGKYMNIIILLVNIVFFFFNAIKDVKNQKNLLVIFQNLQGYDSHLFL